MSRHWAAGSTSAWRRMRLAVLERDARRCRMPLPNGTPCLAPANTVDHILPLADGGAFLDPTNLRAACARHNYAAGARITNRMRGATNPRPHRMTAEALRLIQLLDQLEVPEDAGRTVAQRQLARLDIKARSSALDAACAARRNRSIPGPRPTPNTSPLSGWSW